MFLHLLVEMLSRNRRLVIAASKYGFRNSLTLSLTSIMLWSKNISTSASFCFFVVFLVLVVETEARFTTFGHKCKFEVRDVQCGWC